MLFDIGVGLFIAVVLGVFTSQPPAAGFVFLGAAGALAPDLDTLVWLMRTRGRIDEWMHRHRDLLHYPLIFIPTVGLLGWAVAGPSAGFLIALCAFAHFLHDSGSEGWGIRWLWPFDRRYFQLLRSSGTWTFRALTRQEQDAAVRQGGDPDWYRKAYGRSGNRLRRELAVFAAGMAAAAAWLAIG